MLFGWLIPDKLINIGTNIGANVDVPNHNYAPSTNIRYKDDLVSTLEHEHQQLLSVYTAINEAARLGKIAQIKKLLDQFLDVFNEHALREYTNLYVFLDHSYATKPQLATDIRSFKLEMTQIGKAVRKFCHDWRSTEKRDFDLAVFANELGTLGDILSKRIVTEETRLYPLYENIQKKQQPVSALTL